MIGITVLSVIPLFQKGFPPTHDGEYHIIRFYEFDKVLRSGIWYPRWAPDLNNGFGVPLFNFVYPLPNYVASFIHAFDISFIDAFKLEMVFASFLGAIFFFLWARIFWGDLGGFVSSTFYTYSPYHFLDIYIRGSIGEVWALAFFPAFLWAITIYVNEKKVLHFTLAAIFFALIIFSHNILALLFVPFALCYFLFIYTTKKEISITKLTSTFILGIGIASVFWLPALFESEYVRGLQIYNPTEYFPEIYHLLIPSWGTGFLPDDLGNQMSFQIGLANLFVIIFICIMLSLVILKLKKERFVISLFLLSFFILFFLMTSYSLFFWEIIPLMNFIQFPWRLLSLVILIVSFLAGAVSTIFPRLFFPKQNVIIARLIGFVMIAISVFSTIGYTRPAYYHQRNDQHYISRSNFIDGTNSPGNLF